MSRSNKLRTYIITIILFVIAGTGVLYIGGMPLASLIEAKLNVLIYNGAPVIESDYSSNLEKLVQGNESTMDQSEIQVPELGTQYGTITCDNIAMSAPLYYGDSDEVLLKGVGQYPNEVIPGQGKPLLLSGHDATFFAPLEKIKMGDIITITAFEINYYYKVTSKITTLVTDSTAYDLDQDTEQLILYTCYPFGQLIGDRDKRFFAYCERIPQLKID